MNKKYLILQEECLKELAEASTDHEQESAHIDADIALTNLLEKLGFSKVVEAYEKIPKWYA